MGDGTAHSIAESTDSLLLVQGYFTYSEQITKGMRKGGIDEGVSGCSGINKG